MIQRGGSWFGSSIYTSSREAMLATAARRCSGRRAAAGVLLLLVLVWGASSVHAQPSPEDESADSTPVPPSQSASPHGETAGANTSSSVENADRAAVLGPTQAKPATPVQSCATVPIDLALWTSISVNALYTPSCARNYLGLALGAGKAGELRGIQLGLIAQSVERTSRGVQLGGLVVATGRDGIGLQIAGLVAASGESFVGTQIATIAAAGSHFTGLQLGLLGAAAGDNTRGIQLGGLFAAGGETMRGIQVGALFAATGNSMRGLQTGGLFAAAGDDLHGFQLGGLFAATGDEMQGLQVGGLFSAAGKLAGIQISAGASFTDGGVGAQLAGGLARAPSDLTGLQLAIVNIGGTVHGAQIGLVNIADTVDGAQIGLVNIADRTDAPIGAFSWMRSGPRAIEVAVSDALPVSAALRLGSSHVYSLIGVGADPVHDLHTWGPVAGIGVRAPLERVDLLVDTMWTTQFFGGFDRSVIAQLRARLSLPVSPHVEILAGLTANGFASSHADGADLPIAIHAKHREGDTTYRLWPGIVFGIAAR